MNKLREEVIRVLRNQRCGHLALSTADKPWATFVDFISVGLAVYLIEPRSSDLIFYAESSPHAVLTVEDRRMRSEESSAEIFRVFGSIRILTPERLPVELETVQDAYALKSRQGPNVFVVLQITPQQVCKTSHTGGVSRYETLDIDTDSLTSETQGGSYV